MRNKETYKYIDERKWLIEKFKVVHKNYPNGGYDRLIRQIEEEIADLVEKLYKKEK